MKVGSIFVGRLRQMIDCNEESARGKELSELFSEALRAF
jgi:hypothetical protein